MQIWKPSETTPLVAIALTKIIAQVLKSNGYPAEVVSLVVGRGAIGEKLARDKRLPLISFTGSTKTGREVSKLVHERLGKTILELGGNNAVIVDKDCNLDMAHRAVLFGAVGTAGQRCTSTRRLYLHRSIYSNFLSKLVDSYRQVCSECLAPCLFINFEKVVIGDPLDDKTLMGPLHTKMAVEMYQQGIKEAISQGGKVLYGGKVIEDNFVEPTIIEIEPQAKVRYYLYFSASTYFIFSVCKWSYLLPFYM